ncbi:MAG: helix-turn-helix domain-containing protein [Caldilineaceae bacterium]
MQTETTNSFGYWVRRRRLALDLTQADLARAVSCARVTIVKIERDERRPSRQMANLLAGCLAIPPDEHDRFMAVALGEQAAELLPIASQPFEQQADAHASAQHSKPAGVVPSERKTNLPAPITTFVGRTEELAEITEAISSHRLVTLTGAGGVGKTRLAVEAGMRLVWEASQTAFRDGVWFVELAALASGRMDTALVTQTVASIFKLSGGAERTTVDLLTESLTPRHMLLILDNCEHLVQACAEIAEQLLHRCWHLHILATSREELRIPGEVVVPVLPLALPDLQERIPARVLSAPAAQLFVERIGTAPSPRKVTEEDAVTIAHICHQLDGIPLALELAAPLTRGLSLAQIAAQLRDQMTILTNSYRTAIPRHQTMHSALIWSYHLLASAEQRLLAQLSVFAGGWTLAAAAAVSATEAEDVLLLLRELAAKSLVLVEYTNGQRRFRLLEPIRQFAHAQLAATGEQAAARRRHAEYYLSLAEQMGSARDTPQERDCLQRLAPERDNLRAVNEWARKQNEGVFAQRFNGLLFAFWIYCSGSQEASYWLETALSLQQSEDVHVRTASSLSAEASALDTAGYVAVLQLDFARARVYFERELALYLQRQDQRGTAAALRGISFVAMLEGRLDEAQMHSVQALAISEAAKEPWGTAWGLYDLGYLAFVRGELDAAQAQLEAALPQLVAQGINFGAFRAWIALGRVMKASGKLLKAQGYFQEALRLQQLMRYTNHVAEALEGLAGIAARGGHCDRATQLFAAAHAHREATSWPRWRDQAADYARDLEWARTLCAGGTWEENWTQGSAMTLEQAVVLALAG